MSSLLTFSKYIKSKHHSLLILALFIFSGVGAQEFIKPEKYKTSSAFSYKKTPVSTATYGGVVKPEGDKGLSPYLQRYRVHEQSAETEVLDSIAYPSHMLQDISANYKRQADRPYLQKSFEGNPWTGTPPDNAIAVSNGGILVAATNSDVYYYDEDGNVLESNTFTKLARESFPDYRDILYDPRVSYDKEADRFILIFLHGSNPGNSHLLMYFSVSNDPRDGWHAYSFDGGEADSSLWMDFPNMAINLNEVFVTGNLFDFNNLPTIPVIYQINKWQGYEGEELSFTTYHSFRDEGELMAFTVVPIERARGTSDRRVMEFVNVSHRGGNYISFYTISGELTDTSARLKSASIEVPQYGPSFDAPQRNSDKTLDGSDCRVRKAIYINFTAYIVHHTRNISGETAIMFHKIPLIDIEKVETRVFNQRGFYMAYPSIASAGAIWDDERVIISFLRSGENAFPTLEVITVDESLEASTRLVVTNGTGPIEVSPSNTDQRWGDYSTITRKYNSNTCWVFGCAGNDNNNYTNGIGELTLDRTADVDHTPKPQKAAVYPNPVEDRFQVAFTLPSDQHFAITLVNAKGQNEQVLMESTQQAGPKAFSFNKGALPTGVYLLTIEGEKGYRLTERIVVE